MKLLTLALVLLALGCEKSRVTLEQRHHYELHSGTYEEMTVNLLGTNMGGLIQTEKHQTIFRIDTDTGKTWRYVAGTTLATNSFSDREEWMEIPEKARGSVALEKSNH